MLVLVICGFGLGTSGTLVYLTTVECSLRQEPTPPLTGWTLFAGFSGVQPVQGPNKAMSGVYTSTRSQAQ